MMRGIVQIYLKRIDHDAFGAVIRFIFLCGQRDFRYLDNDRRSYRNRSTCLFWQTYLSEWYSNVVVPSGSRLATPLTTS